MADPLTRYGAPGRVLTPQRTRANPRQVRNNAGGFGFEVDTFTALRRFLILGTAGGTYYVGQRELTDSAVDIVRKAIQEDWTKVIDEAVDVSVKGRAAKQEPTMFTLALLASDEREEVRRAALKAVPAVCRIGTHLFMFVRYAEQFRGWGRAMRRTVANWYLTKQTPQLERELTKYAQRGGWSHRDLLRLSKPRPVRGSEQDLLFGYVAGKIDAAAATPYVAGIAEMRRATDVKRTLELVAKHEYPWEVIPSEQLAHAEVWRALAPKLGMTALVRNLGRMTANGAIEEWSDFTDLVAARLEDEEQIRRSRIHPMQVLVAEATYRRGAGDRGKLSWSPNQRILDGLDKAFHLSFPNHEPAGKGTLIGLDVSGSMHWGQMTGSQLTPMEAGAAMSLIFAATEPKVKTMAFSDGFQPFPISPTDSVAAVVDRARGLRFSRTDCSLPMQFALHHKLPVETFVVITDNETWAGNGHPHEWLAKYRRETGIDAKMVVVGMTATKISIADPSDPGMLDVVGFDTATPKLVADFSAGRI